MALSSPVGTARTGAITTGFLLATGDRQTKLDKNAVRSTFSMLLLEYCHHNRLLSSPVALQIRFKLAIEKCKRRGGHTLSFCKCYVDRRISTITPSAEFRVISTLMVWPYQTHKYAQQYTSSSRSYSLPKNLQQLVALQKEERRQRQTELLQFTRNHVKRRINQLLSQKEIDVMHFQELVRKKRMQQRKLIPEAHENVSEDFTRRIHHDRKMQFPTILDLEDDSKIENSDADYTSKEKGFAENQSEDNIGYFPKLDFAEPIRAIEEKSSERFIKNHKYSQKAEDKLSNDELPGLKTQNGMQMDSNREIGLMFANKDRVFIPKKYTTSDDDEELVYDALITDYLVQNKQINRILENEKSSVVNKQEEEDLVKALYFHILELLQGLNQRKYQLKTADFNIILSALMLSSYGDGQRIDSNDDVEADAFSFDAAENMHTVYQLMKDRSKSSAGSLTPNVNTVCMVTSVLLREGARSAAANIWGEFLSQKSKTAKGDEQNKKSLYVLDDQSLTVGIKCLTSAGKNFIGHIETIIENAAAVARYDEDEYASTNTIPEGVIFDVIKCYIDLNEPEKLRDLVQVCIRSRQYDNKTVNQIIKQSLRLGNLGGNQDGIQPLERIKHCECILNMLRQEGEYFVPHISLWKLLLKTLSHLSRQNPSSCFPLIAEACQMMIAQKQVWNSRINDGLNYFPGYLVMKVGIDAASFVQNPQLAVDLLRWGWDASDQSFSGRGSTNQHDSDYWTDTKASVNESNDIKETSDAAAPSDDKKFGKEEFSFTDLISDFLSKYDEDKKSNTIDEIEEESKTIGDALGFGTERNQVLDIRSNKMSASILFSVLHLCFRLGNSTLAYETFRYCIDNSSLNGDYPTFPKSIWSQFYSMVIACRAEKGETEEAKEILHEMPNYGITPRYHFFNFFSVCAYPSCCRI